MKFHTKIRESFKPQSFRNSLFTAYAAALLMAAGPAQAAPMYTITDLGVLPGRDFSYAAGINDSGQVVGNSYNATGQYSAFLWNKDTGMTDLGSLPGGVQSFAQGINNSGQVVGSSETPDASNAFLWHKDTGMTNLGTLPGGSGYSYAHGVNDSGQVVGESLNSTSLRAFLWDKDSGMTDLGTLPGGGDDSSAYGINDLGQVVGRSDSATGTRAFLWDKDSGMTDLGTLRGRGSNDSYATGINDSGQVVGVAYDGSPTTGYTAYGAFLWEADAGMLNLNNLLVDRTGWILLSASGINNSGQTAGYGYHNGAGRAFLLTPVDAGPETGVIAPGVLPGSVLGAVDDNMTSMQPGLFQSFSDSGFIDGVAGFDPAKETFVLVHGWNGAGSYGSSHEKEAVHGWVTDMAGELREKSSDANILAWNWTASADSTARDDLPSLTYVGNLGACLVGTSTDCGIVPLEEVRLQADYLAQTFGGLYSGFVDEAGGVQFLGHSLGAAIAANAVNFIPLMAPDVDRLTLFDPPENRSAIKIGGKVDLDKVLPLAVQKYPDITIENYSADSKPFSVTGYGIPYADVANTNLLGYVHSKEVGDTPMDWYQSTIHPNGDCNAHCRERGLGESKSDLHDRYDQTWANLIPFAPYILSRVDDLAERAIKVVLESWHDLKDWGTKVIQAGVDAALYIADATVTLIGKVGSAIASLADGVTAGVSELADWTSTGVASFVKGLGLQLTSNSPSYAYRTLHIPETADTIYFEFMPQVWALGDAYIILFDDDVLYRIDGQFFENAWMDTGFLDVSRWAGRDVLLTIGLLSDEAGHQITTGGFGFTSRVAITSASIPEPGTLLLLGTGLLVLLRLRYSMAWQAGVRRKLQRGDFMFAP